MEAGERSYCNGVFATEWAFGKSGTGGEQIVVVFNTEKGRRTWYGSFSEAAADFTLEALENCGWDGISLTRLDGMGSLAVDLVIDVEEYDGKLREKVRFINKPRAAREPLEASGMSALEQRLAGKIAERAAKRGDNFKDPFAT